MAEGGFGLGGGELLDHSEAIDHTEGVAVREDDFIARSGEAKGDFGAGRVGSEGKELLEYDVAAGGENGAGLDLIFARGVGVVADPPVAEVHGLVGRVMQLD